MTTKKAHASNRNQASKINWFRSFEQDRIDGEITGIDLPNSFGVLGNRIFLADAETVRPVTLIQAIDAYILNEEVSNSSSGTAVELLKVIRHKLTGKAQAI